MHHFVIMVQVTKSPLPKFSGQIGQRKKFESKCTSGGILGVLLNDYGHVGWSALSALLTNITIVMSRSL
jgi:hypothetical protein